MCFVAVYDKNLHVYSCVPCVNRVKIDKTRVDTHYSGWINLKVGLHCDLFLVGASVKK